MDAKAPTVARLTPPAAIPLINSLLVIVLFAIRIPLSINYFNKFPYRYN
jgi:hypothetical protein